ncbi:nucleoside phosphorylase domain-containing protein [Xylaria sp. CBS 124048]|nr:nucleoside phosphorylase domain-containing protein [Xylaria sp. CBS 124048]
MIYPRNYSVAWLAPLEIEARAALLMLDHVHEGRFPMKRGDDYVFRAGDICGHNVIIASCPPGEEYGTASAVALASQVKKTFPNLWFGLLVGVAAGIPDHVRTPPRDIRLGDILVALPTRGSAGIIPYDLDKLTGNDGSKVLQSSRVFTNTETVVRSAIGHIKLHAPYELKAFLPHYERIEYKFHSDGTFVDPGQVKDTLYQVDENGVECQVSRQRRPDVMRTRVWYGPIGSGEQLIKNARLRDELRNKYNIIGLGVAVAGMMSQIPVGVILGASNYGDGHEHKEWQPYAAAMAAAYAKSVLAEIGSNDTPQKTGSQDLIRAAEKIQVLNMLHTLPYRDRKNRNQNPIAGTCDWLASQKLFRDWLGSESSRLLWVSAEAGCGKSVLAKHLIDSVLPTESRTVCYFFFKDDVEDQRNMVTAFRCILYQLFEQKPSVLSDAIIRQFGINGANLLNSFDELLQVLTSAAEDPSAGEIICVLDAIDECEDQGKRQLTQKLRRLYDSGGPGRNFNLKFLVTSRPSSIIRDVFWPLEGGFPVIELSNNSRFQLERISRELDVLMQNRELGMSGHD